VFFRNVILTGGLIGVFGKRAKKGVSKSGQKVLKVADLCHFMTFFWSWNLGYFQKCHFNMGINRQF
jgi:hypothetical protein